MKEKPTAARKLGVMAAIGLTMLFAARVARSQAKPTGVALAITGDLERPLSLTMAELRAMPQRSLKAYNDHEHQTHVYEGVPLAALLHEAGVPQGERLRGAAMTTYVLAEASDGYRVIFALPELDSSFQDSGVLVAYAADGKPLSAHEGPLRLVVPHDKRPARWIRMLVKIRVVTISR